MSIFNFKNKKNTAQAIAFVDYRYWYMSLKQLYNIRPKFTEFYNGISAEYKIKKIVLFRNFTHPFPEEKIAAISELEERYINLGSTGACKMLDCIYQEIIENPEVDRYIFFTGEGHYSSIIKFLIHKKKKIIGYEIFGTISDEYKNMYDKYIELLAEEDVNEKYKCLIIRNFSYIQTQQRREIYPTYYPTVQHVANFYNEPEELICKAMNELIYDGVVYEREERISFNYTKKILDIDWERAIEAGLWIV